MRRQQRHYRIRAQRKPYPKRCNQPGSEHLKQPDILLQQPLLQKVVQYMVAVDLTSQATFRYGHRLIIYQNNDYVTPM
jgi:hypothetical protein